MWYKVTLHHLDLLKIVLQFQLPVVTIVLKQVVQGLPHFIWCIISMEVWDNMISNSFWYDPSHLCNTFHPLCQVLSICCWRLRNIIVYEFLQLIVFQHYLHPILPSNIIQTTLKGLFKSQSIEQDLAGSEEWSWKFYFTCKDKLVFSSFIVISTLIPFRNSL